MCRVHFITLFECMLLYMALALWSSQVTIWWRFKWLRCKCKSYQMLQNIIRMNLEGL